MPAVHARCCGLDVHQETVVACVLLTADDGAGRQRVRTFGTMTEDLLALGDWLGDLDVTQVAMESRGVYWRPVFNLLEDGRTLTLVNAQPVKAVPGRKTAVRDAEWLADLLRHGLLRARVIPPAPVRAVRALTRSRTGLVQPRTQEANRRHKRLEGANIKRAVVAADILGKSGRAMLEALLAGGEEPAAPAELARGRLRAKRPALQRALTGRVQPHHRVRLRESLTLVDFLDAGLARLTDELAACLAPFAAAVALLQTIPGVGTQAAASLVGAIGTEMGRCPSSKHLASWAGVCPGNTQRGGKRLRGKTTQGDRWRRGILGEVAWAIARTKGTYRHAQYHRIARKRGKYRAVVAVRHSVLAIASHMLRDGRPYAELGPDYFDHLQTARLEQHHVKRLNALGYSVTLTPLPPAEPVPA